ncbi:nucleoporin [Scytonema hofmannii FACHB-248]|uniref:Nucleoporin n=1 Tax=Scytonema hofmannii FACHB-248 TaxID=1842502 RepID=A0ABR8GJ57_9CYAN|nr:MULTISPECIES: nucleoporin [Nostocales]MBD2603420.1 nucleoporin [Scytonema hofmannii FACHB-248]
MTRNAIRPSLFGTLQLNPQQQSRNAIRPSLFGTTKMNSQQSQSAICPSLFGTLKTNPQEQLKLDIQSSKELAKEEEMKLRKIEDDVRRRQY